MRRVDQLAADTRNGHLIVNTDGSRMRVHSVLPVHDGQTVIVQGRSATGPKGIAYSHDQLLTRLD